MTSAPSDPAAFLRQLFQAGLDAVSADTILPRLLTPEALPRPKGRTLVIAAGKGAAAMAAVAERAWGEAPQSDGPLSGLAVTRYHHGQELRRITLVEAAHPTPDAAGMKAAAQALDLAAALTPDDLLLCLLSGGGSALMVAPAPGVTLADKQALTKALLRSGAAIGEINTVRKHLSRFKGGRLAAVSRAPVVTLAVSDVPGDDPGTIASGPTVPDATTLADARAVLARHGIEPGPSIRAALDDPANETPKPGSLPHARYTLAATPIQALEAAAQVARAAGVTPLVLGDDLEGEAAEVAKVHAGIARGCLRHGQPLPRPCVLLSGGETSVTVRGQGRGGRNAEFLLALAVALKGDPVWALACDTDGIDGTEDNAGALLTPDTLARAQALGIDAAAHLANNDGYGFFQALGDLVVTGPTRTNVNDFRALYIP
ncbi:glycerate kinase type-2 family protein [Nitrospirillum pindoramense]|uniref:Glycerate 2-kinase n=1 Tax=Nitrospirillum amazonense TaxID=28077 RepID=A0A560H842_9PROT|nr:glycerate kinase [Nitrospirillum amazonense]TWB42483.1 glycerate 2-kinase [Nitrospirillum amazonense]